MSRDPDLRVETVTPAPRGAIKVKEGDRVGVYYKGTFTDGKQFDTNVGSGKTFDVTIGQHGVVPGFEQAILGMGLGEKVKATLLPRLAYGERGAPPRIPPNTTLVFEIEVASINGASAPK
jgi:FKBP-type peptidyl-prolyl cis-trans isomerase